MKRYTFPERQIYVAKKFHSRSDQIRDIVPGLGACYASDHITVEGRKVGFMYREAPDNDTDSGWRFLSGAERQEYLDDPKHLGIYDVNTIANYDEGIVALLSAAVGSAYRRTASDEFVAEDMSDDDA